jgi:hypothetical protein
MRDGDHTVRRGIGAMDRTLSKHNTKGKAEERGRYGRGYRDQMKEDLKLPDMVNERFAKQST